MYTYIYIYTIYNINTNNDMNNISIVNNMNHHMGSQERKGAVDFHGHPHPPDALNT